MSRTTASGACLAAAATLIVGLAVAASSRLTHFPTAGGQAARYAIAATVLGLLAWRGGKLSALAGLRAREWLALAALAATGLVGFNLAILGSVSRIDPSLTGTIVGCSPIALSALGPLQAGRRPRAAVIVAAVVVAAGAAVVEAAGPHASPVGVLMALGAVAGEVLFSLLAVPLLPRLGPLTLSFSVCGLAAIMLVLLVPMIDGPSGIRMPSAVEAAALLFLALPVTVGGFVGWYSALERLGAERAGLFLGLIPVSAMAGSVLVGTSVLSPGKALGALLVGAGVAGGLALTAGRRGPG